VGVLHTNEARPGWKEKDFRRNTTSSIRRRSHQRPESSAEGRGDAYGFHYVALRKTDRRTQDTRSCRAVIVPTTHHPGGRAPVHRARRCRKTTRPPAPTCRARRSAGVRGPDLELLGLDDPRYYDRKTCNFLGAGPLRSARIARA